jgi:hypothetical protein
MTILFKFDKAQRKKEKHKGKGKKSKQANRQARKQANTAQPAPQGSFKKNNSNNLIQKIK